MNSNLIYIPYTDYNDFIQKRSQLDGFGGSDIGTIMGLNDRKSSLEFFHEKIGYYSNTFTDNIHTYSGRVLESIIIDKFWQYYNPDIPTDEELVKNAGANKIIRTAEKVNFIIVNPKFPHLFYSPDSFFEGLSGKKSILEAKAALGYVVNKWENNLPPSYVTQVNQGMLITGFQEAELALFKDGRFLEVFPLEPSKEIMQAIEIYSHEFYLRVKKGREIMKSAVPAEEKSAMVAEIEPAPDSSEAYGEYLKSKYRPDHYSGIIDGDLQHLEIVKKYNKFYKQEKEAGTNLTEVKNLIKKELKDRGCHTIDFGKMGKISWLPDRNGKTTLRVNVKTE